MDARIIEAVGGILGTVGTVTVTAAVTWCVQTVRGIALRTAEDRRTADRRQAARDKGTLALLHIKLMDAYEAYVVDGNPMSYDRRRDIDQLYEAYHALGGNGTGTDVYRAVCEVEICPVRRAGRVTRGSGSDQKANDERG